MEHRGQWGTVGWLASVVLLWAGSAQAYPITDPQGLLQQLDLFLSGRSFDSAFKLDDSAEGTRLHKDCYVDCGRDGCGALCTGINEPLSRKVTIFTGDQAAIELDDGTTEVWTRDQFSAQFGNAVRQSLTALDFQIPGSLEASEFRDKAYTLGSQTLACKEIVFLFHPEGRSTTFKIRYVVSRDVPFAGQIVQMAAFGSYLFQLKSVTRQ